MPDLTFLPPDLPLWVAAVLIASALITSAITAAVGLGGGVALLGIMGSLVPVAVLIPVHGVVQLGSNAGRTMVQRAHIDRHLLLLFVLGSVVGAAIGGQLVVTLPDTLLKIGVGLFILYMIWGPKPGQQEFKTGPFLAAGAGATFLTMFFGATGPFVAAMMPTARMSRHQIVGTHAACMTVQHGLKVFVFGLLGFAFGEWLAIMVLMVAAGFVGTIIGSRLLNHLPERTFKQAFRAVLTLIALNLIVAGAGLY